MRLLLRWEVKSGKKRVVKLCEDVCGAEGGNVGGLMERFGGRRRWMGGEGWWW
jgi:hypothetical protein